MKSLIYNLQWRLFLKHEKLFVHSNAQREKYVRIWQRCSLCSLSRVKTNFVREPALFSIFVKKRKGKKNFHYFHFITQSNFHFITQSNLVS